MIFAVIRICVCFVMVLTAMGGHATGRESKLRYEKAGLKPTPLDTYVAKPDESFSWKVVATRDTADMKFVTIQLTSQTWQPENVSPGVWKHWLKVCVPKEASGEIGMLFISGGSRDERQPEQPSSELMAVAAETKSIVAELRCVPNQPIVFAGDGVERKEDNLLSASWQAAIDNQEIERVGQLAMAKAAVRAMDTLEAWSAEDAGIPNVSRFVVSGASKRGWTTWLSAAVDTRVEAIIPIVIDMLNMRASLQHQLDVYGEWSPALKDYQRRGFDKKIDDPKIDKIIQVVDPYVYRERFQLPKLLVNATGDEFFLPDSSQFYFDALPGEKNLTYVPNASHSLAGSNAMDSIIGFYSCILANERRPTLRWKQSAEKGWVISSDAKPTKVNLWQANNPNKRDFRLAVLGPGFESSELKPQSDGTYLLAKQRLSAKQGWTASLVEAEFPTPCGRPLRLTTPVWVHSHPGTPE